MGDQLGTIEVGPGADLLVVYGDPAQDTTCLKDQENIQAIVKEGAFYEDAI